jgi:hypothetical protein
MVAKRKCCDIIYWRHDDGWDAYRKSDCEFINRHWVPRWFDNFIIEDYPTKASAQAEMREWHPLGVCLVI